MFFRRQAIRIGFINGHDFNCAMFLAFLVTHHVHRLDIYMYAPCYWDVSSNLLDALLHHLHYVHVTYTSHSEP